ncbi:uncharacterized protein CIMG_13660 [Coccidioides immitis RS]|uniref:Uncharacterized protein n=1 Tax=Coccidioides immitis (strain RS) TaxID=246410 RepID=J3KAB0_COCIM|nr:uncharacterized protein CIMG_13660 [Coccidioides immitis RS]EAS31942.3 hypothetical protein CIMG_13660 [Coccidioides immitis RS]
MTKDQEIKKSGSESTMVEDTTELYVTMSQDENRRIVVHFHISMPSPGTANAPWFDGRDAILFIERFYQMCKNHGGLPEKLQNKIIDKAKLNLSNNMSSIDFRKIVQVTMDLIDQYVGNKKVFKEDEMKQKEMEKLGESYQLANKLPTVEALKRTASSVKTEESESKFKAKSSESTNIKAAIEKMTNKFTNLVLAIRVQSNQIQGNSNQYYMLQREGPPKPIPNYTTNVTTNFATVQENTQPQLVNSYVAQNGSPMTSYHSSGQEGA